MEGLHVQYQFTDEGPLEEAVNLDAGEHLDLAYYLMLLHASEKGKFGALKTMFSPYASTYDPFDYHMIWHQRAVLEAVGAFSSNDLHVLDMGLVSQLLCLGQCHWAIYVVLHIHHRDDFPYLHATIIREILFQYCEAWCTQEEQHKFIEDLGVPAAWLHEAMVSNRSCYWLHILLSYRCTVCFQNTSGVCVTQKKVRSTLPFFFVWNAHSRT